MFDRATELRTAYSPAMVDFYTTFCRKDGLPVGNVATSRLDNFIYGYLLAVPKFHSALPSLIEWINEAIDKHEEKWFGESPSFHLMLLFRGRAVASWLKGEDDQLVRADLVRAFESFLNYSRQTHSSKNFDEAVLGDLMILAGLSGSYQAGVEEYERLVQGESKSLTAGRVGYLFCQTRLAGNALTDDYFSLEDKILFSHVEGKWLKNGYGTRVALWMMHRFEASPVGALEKLNFAWNFMKKSR
ncbi:hypothetical protein [Variovorax sp. DT-64]|uniref:hypothetical protein n=1 Tax=Variovorax sp. DT-64 TaxID=3396160 RepID=UPI003F1ACC12